MSKMRSDWCVQWVLLGFYVSGLGCCPDSSGGLLAGYNAETRLVGIRIMDPAPSQCA